LLCAIQIRCTAQASWRIAKVALCRGLPPRDGARKRHPDRLKELRMAAIDTLVTVFGGSGFLGRHVVRALVKRDYRVRVAVRRPELAGHLQPLGKVGQIHAVQANLRYPASVTAAMRDASIVVNLCGILTEGGRQTFDAVQAQGAGGIARAAQAIGARMVHVSAIGADANSESAYARAKAAGETAVLDAVPGATILRPSLVFGPEDAFTNRFAALARMSPVMPLIGGGTRMQPVYVGDVATAVADAVDGKTRAGATYELGGPEVLTMREIIEIILATIERKRMLVSVPFALARLQAMALQFAPGALKLTPDQVTMLRVDNVVSEAAKAAGLTLEGLGISADSLEAIAPQYLWMFRATGQFAHNGAH
jgi:NADH dehydrogenase